MLGWEQFDQSFMLIIGAILFVLAAFLAGRYIFAKRHDPPVGQDLGGDADPAAVHHDRTAV